MYRRFRARMTYANVLSTLCLFLILSGGTAIALSGSNTVFTDDIVDGEIKYADIGVQAVSSTRIWDQSIQSIDLKDGEVKTADIGANQIISSRVQDNSLTGADIDESTLSGVRASNVQHIMARPTAPPEKAVYSGAGLTLPSGNLYWTCDNFSAGEGAQYRFFASSDGALVNLTRTAPPSSSTTTGAPVEGGGYIDLAQATGTGSIETSALVTTGLPGAPVTHLALHAYTRKNNDGSRFCEFIGVATTAHP